MLKPLNLFTFYQKKKKKMSVEQDKLDICKEKFVNLISELDDSQFHEFQHFVTSAMGKLFIYIF
jgi:F0F1-type ATP synthase membrane subunit a